MYSFDEAYAAGADDDAGLLEYGLDDVSRQLDNVNQFLSVVNADMVKHTKNAELPKMMAVWQDEVWGPWKEFYKSTKKLTSLNMFRDSTYRRAEAYRQLGLRYRENLLTKERTDPSVVVTPTRVPPSIRKPDGMPAVPSSTPLPSISLNPKSMDNGFPWKWLLIGGGVIAGGYLAYRYWPKGGGHHMLAAPEEQVNNPPPWVTDPDIWETAKTAVTPYRNRYRNVDAVITHVYKQMGGRVG